MKKYRSTTANSAKFNILFESLSRKLAYDMENTEVKQSIKILHDWLFDNKEPVILVESIVADSATYTCYYPLDSKSYCAALPLCGLVRFNISYLFGDPKQVFTGGVDRRGKICCLYVTLDVPCVETGTEDTIEFLQALMETFATSLGLSAPRKEKKENSDTNVIHKEYIEKFVLCYFSDALKDLRKSQNLSQGELAKTLEVSEESIRAYENRERMPDIGFINLIRYHFDLSCDDLLGGESIW